MTLGRLTIGAVLVAGCGGRLPDTSTDAATESSVDATAFDGQSDAMPTVDAGALMGCAKKVVAGGFNTCAIDVAGALWCWGSNALGQLGQGYVGGTTCNGDGCAMSPVRVDGLGQDVVDVAIGADHVCAIKADQSVWCWGHNKWGQLGDGTNADESSPVQVGTFHATTIGAGSAHTCAIAPDGSVWCWGFNLDGQLGDGTTTNQPSPVQVASMTTATEVRAGDLFTCARATNGAAWCWGHGVWGERGDGTTTLMSPPVQVVTVGNSVEQLGARLNLACASETDGGLACWGLGTLGDLGDDAGIQPTPANVQGLPSVQSIAVGGAHVCALDGSGTAFCFGDNAVGSIGGTWSSGPTPRQVAGLPTSVKQLAAGGAHTCALASNGAISCWGQNTTGQLGNGSPSVVCYGASTCERMPVSVPSSCH